MVSRFLRGARYYAKHPLEFLRDYPAAFREVLAWSIRPGHWYWLPITIWFLPFLAYIYLHLQARDWAKEAKRQYREAVHDRSTVGTDTLRR